MSNLDNAEYVADWKTAVIAALVAAKLSPAEAAQWAAQRLADARRLAERERQAEGRNARQG